MKNILKKVLAIILALGFCFTSIPAGQIAAETLDMTDVTGEQTTPPETGSEEIAAEPEETPIDSQGATDDGSGYDTTTDSQGATDDGSGYDAATDSQGATDDGSGYDTTTDTGAPAADTSADTNEVVQVPPADPDVNTGAPENPSPSEPQQMTEIIPAPETPPTETPNEVNNAGQDVTTPNETTADTKTLFIYEDEEIYVEATLDPEDALSDKAVFVVKQIFEDSLLDTDRGLFQWSNELLDKYLEKNDWAQVNTFFYDMYFELDGQRLMPAKEFKINLTYKKDKVLNEDAKRENVRIYHLDDNDYTAEIEAFDTDADLRVNENGSVTTAEFRIIRYRYTPLMISMIETKEEHEARLAEEASKEAEENAAAGDEKKLIIMDEPDQEPGAETEENGRKLITMEDEDETDTTEEKNEEEEEEEEEEAAPERRYYTNWGNDVDITVILSDPAQVPDSAEVVVTAVTPDAENYNYDAYIEALNSSDESITYTPENTLLYDIKFVDTVLDENGEIAEEVEYEPTEGTVKVILQFNNNQLSNEINAKKNQNVTVNHLVTDAEADTTDISAENISVVEVDAAVQLKGTDKVAFNTDSFSVYAFSYTVDYEYSVNGKLYQFSIPGGGFVSFSQLVELLGLTDDINSEENEDEIEIDIAEDITEIGSIEEMAEVNEVDEAEEVEAVEEVVETEIDTTAETDESAVADGEGADDIEAPLTLGEVEVSDSIRDFLADVESVVFSSPELVDVSKAGADTTVGQIKESRGLECQYSAELTEDQIAEINEQTVEAGDWALISLQPFTSEETLTVIMKDGEVFTIRVTDAQIKKTVIDAKGDAWEITVTYGEDAQIPEGAELKVREILPEDEEYAHYYQQSLEKISAAGTETEDTQTDEAADSAEEQTGEITASFDNYAHIFDIQIWAEDQEIQPASDVIVNIQLLDAPEDENTDLKVVHFGRDGLEVMELTENDEAKSETTELNFVTDEFSVYSVIDVNNNNLSDTLAKGPYALVTGIAGDPGATTGYWENDWKTQDYFTIIVNANAMMDTAGVQVVAYDPDNAWMPNVTGLAAEGVHAWVDSSGSYVGGDATQWYFEKENNGSRYRIYSLDNNNNKKYVYQTNQEGGDHRSLALTTARNDATLFTITPNSDGTMLIYCNVNGKNWYLHNNTSPAEGWNEWVVRNYLITKKDSTPSGNEYKFRLCKYSRDFDSLAAQKVSASAVTTNANYVIYRKIIDEQGIEVLYALAHDGSFIRVYDGGDSIYWRETDKNIYWNYQTENGYPVLFTRDPETNDPIYINPSYSDSQTLSDTANGLTLLGKDNGEYSTAIECWDQTAYDYAGLHVTVDSSGTASLSASTRTANSSDEFLFAVATEYPGTDPEPVDTVDSDSLGIKITMFDYGRNDYEYKAGDKLSEMTAIAGSAEYTPHAAHALVIPYLDQEDRVPSGTAGAMTGLFSSGGAIKYSQSNVNHLFLQSYYDENGTFRYRSEDNYAYLGLDGQTDFTVYRQAATPYSSLTSDYLNIGHTYYYHGHFMPFNDIDTNNNLSRLMNQYGNAYENGEIIGEIPLGDGRTYEDLYGIQGIQNFFTGMKMEANFTQPRNGKLDNGDSMIFKFTGDDDMWVYIDDVLVLDIGGIHEPLSGTINFATGAVTNPAGSSLAGTTTLYQIFQNVLNNSSTPDTVKEKIRSITWKDVNNDGTPDTFADYTNHSFSSFYMERGAGASNLDIQFNLKVVLTNQFTVQKEIPADVDPRFDNQVYRFQATYKDNGQDKPLHAGINGICTSVIYKDKENAQGQPVPVAVDNDGYFTLKAGEAAIFMMADESIQYNVKEVDLNDYNLEMVDGKEHVEINGQQAVISYNEAEAGYAAVGHRSNVLYTNYPKTQDLLITKHISKDSAPLEEGEHPVFEFRVYLETTITDASGTAQQRLVPYSYGPYYLTKVVDDATHYFTLTGVNNAPVDKGTNPVSLTSGRNGSINSIPPEYTIVIPKLVVGTNFYVEEYFSNIPEGYEFARAELTAGTFDAHSDWINDKTRAEVIAGDGNASQEFYPDLVGRIKDGVNAESHVYNRKPAVSITVQKAWDPDPAEGTTVTVELHRYVKIKKGTISVTLYDNNGAPIEGAEFVLYKDGVATTTEVTTDVNGNASATGLEAGTYKLVQKSTPTGYSMEGYTTETEILTVVDGATTPQTLSQTLYNTALVTAGVVTLTVTDSGAGSGTAGTPIVGAEFTLYKNGSIYISGCRTDGEGKIVVDNLGAGEYYFVQTGTASDYKLPNVTRTEGFTVQENPGVTQEFTQSMTNSLKGKGTVSLTLKKGSGEAISGAYFTLTGNGVSETAQTGSDGKILFSTELYEGTYTVHQVNTGNAGDAYATAADQNVTIQANSRTDQQQSLTFINEEAAGNVTITMYKGCYSQYNQSVIAPSISSLKAGVEYTFRIGGMPSNNVENGDTIGYTTNFVPNQEPKNVITIPKSSWIRSGDTYYYDFNYTPQQGDTTYIFGIVSNWGLMGQDITFTLVGDGKSMAAALPSIIPLRTTRTSLGNPNINATRSVIHSDASPAAAPSGYATDSTFVESCTLTAADSWQHTFDGLDKYDADGNPYYYYIVETNCSDTDYWIDSYSGDPLNQSGTITVTNKKEKTGNLKVTKQLLGNVTGNDDKTFMVTIKNSSNQYLQSDGSFSDTEHVFTVSVSTPLEITNIPIDTYTVTEKTDAADVAIEGYIWNGSESTISGSGAVEYNQTTTVALKNKYTEIQKVDVNATKAWLNADNSTTAPDGASVTFELFADGEATGNIVVLDGVTRADEINNDTNLTDEEKTAAIAALAQEESGEFIAWKAKWRNLRKYSDDAQTKLITYTVKEVSGYTGYTNQDPNGVSTDGTITNKQDAVNFDILKVAEGTQNPLDGASFTIQPVKATSETTNPDYAPGSSPSEPVTTGADGKASFTGITPGYYEVKETKTPTGYVITGEDAFYIKIDAAGIKLLEKEVIDGKLSFKEATSATVNNVTISTVGSTVTFTVENTPGPTLPSTGGIGTTLFTILGALLITGAGAGILIRGQRRRKKNQN